MPITQYAPKGTVGSELNLFRYYAMATDEELESGEQWYKDAHVLTKYAAHDLDVSHSVFVGVVAAISPMRSWDSNIGDAVDLVKYWQDTGETQSCPVFCPVGRKPFETAQRILESGDYVGILSGQKVTSFAHNILYPSDPSVVTIDSHAIRAWLGFDRGSTIKVARSVFLACEADYMQFAANLGMIPCDAQAIVWQVRKRWQRHMMAQ